MRKLLEIWRLLNLPCEEMSALASQELDAELGFWPRVAFKLHLLYCSACRRYRRQIRLLRAGMREVYRRLVDEDPPAEQGMPADVRERIGRALREW